MTLASYLAADHARLDALLRTSVADGFDADSFEQFRAGLLRHIGIEEKLLPPLPAIARSEHAALVSLLVPTPDAALAGEIARLLATHNAREEGPDGIYAALPSDDALLARAQATPPPPLARHFDGLGTVRTAAEALERARKRRP
jgi:hypothetical protein